MSEGDPNYTINAGLSIVSDEEAIASLKWEMLHQDSYNFREANTYSYSGLTMSNANSYNNGISIRYDNIKDTYYKSGQYFEPNNDYSYSRDDLSANERWLIGVVFDMFAGDAKNYCNLDGDVISCRLEKGQIPEFFQALIAVVTEQAARTLPDYQAAINDFTPSSSMSIESTLENSLLSVIKNASFDAVEARGVIDENGMVNDVSLLISISGSDKDGAPHTISLDVTGKIDSIGSTTAAPLDTTGKKVVDNTWEEDDYSYEDVIEEKFGTIDHDVVENLLENPEVLKTLEDPALRASLEEYLKNNIIDSEAEIINKDKLDDTSTTAAEAEAPVIENGTSDETGSSETGTSIVPDEQVAPSDPAANDSIEPQSDVVRY